MAHNNTLLILAIIIIVILLVFYVDIVPKKKQVSWRVPIAEYKIIPNNDIDEWCKKYWTQ